MQIYISRDGEQNGPYSIEDVNAYLKDGILLPTDLACQHGMTEWVPITQIPSVLLPGDSAATPMSLTEIPKHFFISYSRKDELIVKQVVAHLLRVGIDVWIDRDDLTPGTPDWEKSIRTAIDESYGVILLASQNSSQSEYVRGEVSLAASKESRIFPVWIDGNKWIECAPLQLAHTQYIDCRQSSLQSGLEQLDKALFDQIKRKLSPHFQLSPVTRRETVGTLPHEPSVWPPPGYIRVMLDDSPWHTTEDSGTAAFLRLSDHGCMHSVLDCLWQNYLTDSQPPLSYGSSWVLKQETHGSIAPLLIPWSWLITVGTGMHARSILKERKATVRQRIEELRRLDENLKLGDQERKVSPSVQAEFGGVEPTAKVVRERIPAELEALEIEMPDEALESDAKFNYRPDLNWLQKSSLEACGLKAGSCWEILPCDFVPVGIAVRDRRIIDAMMHYRKAESLMSEKLIEYVQIEKVPELCTERVVVLHDPLIERARPPAGMAIVQSSIEIEDDAYFSDAIQRYI